MFPKVAGVQEQVVERQIVQRVGPRLVFGLNGLADFGDGGFGDRSLFAEQLAVSCP